MFFAAVTKLAPILLSLAADAYYLELTDQRWFASDYLMGMSPVGTVMLGVIGVPSAMPGLAWQALLAFSVAWFAHRAAVKRRTALPERAPSVAARPIG